MGLFHILFRVQHLSCCSLPDAEVRLCLDIIAARAGIRGGLYGFLRVLGEEIPPAESVNPVDQPCPAAERLEACSDFGEHGAVCTERIGPVENANRFHMPQGLGELSVCKPPE